MLGLLLTERNYNMTDEEFITSEIIYWLDKYNITGSKRDVFFRHINTSDVPNKQILGYMNGQDKNVDRLIQAEDVILGWVDEVYPGLSEINRLRTVSALRYLI